MAVVFWVKSKDSGLRKTSAERKVEEEGNAKDMEKNCNQVRSILEKNESFWMPNKTLLTWK